MIGEYVGVEESSILNHFSLYGLIFIDFLSGLTIGHVCYRDSVGQSCQVDETEIEQDEGDTTLYSFIYPLMMLVLYMIELRNYCSQGLM